MLDFINEYPFFFLHFSNQTIQSAALLVPVSIFIWNPSFSARENQNNCN